MAELTLIQFLWRCSWAGCSVPFHLGRAVRSFNDVESIKYKAYRAEVNEDE